MPKILDSIKGRRFGGLVALEFMPGGKHPVWRCICDCGIETSATITNLLRGHRTSCGCMAASRLADATRTHGLSRSKVYATWCGMKARCSDPNSTDFKNYGARGIRVCERWAESFDDFLTDMGHPPSRNHSIDRIDNAGGYEPGNCRWAIKRVQANNTRANVILHYKGRSQTLAEWARELGLPYIGLRHRIGRGWEVHDAFERPFRGHGVPVSYQRPAPAIDRCATPGA